MTQFAGHPFYPESESRYQRSDGTSWKCLLCWMREDQHPVPVVINSEDK